MFQNSKSKYIDFSKLLDKAHEVYDDLPPVKRRRKRRLFFKIIKYFSLIFAALLILIFVIIGVNFINLKTIFQEVISGKDNLEYSVLLINEHDYNGGREFAVQANYNFNNALNLLEGYIDGTIIKRIDYLKDQLHSMVLLVSAAEVLSNAVVKGSDFVISLKTVTANEDTNFTKMTKEERGEILGTIHRSGPELYEIKNDINSVLLSLSSIDFNGALFPVKNKIQELENRLGEANDLLGKAIPMSELLPFILGYPNKSSFLVMLQNSDELRPTGGFLGTYGILETEIGDILRFDTHDIYHMDMPIKDKLSIVPPEPLKKYLGVEKWFMRDANWSPDWPEASKKLIEFYKKENALLPPKDQINNFDGNFDGVIGITPEFITDLLAIVGPIVVEGETYNQDNFLKLLEYKVEKDYIALGTPSWHRKEVIGKISSELKNKLFNLSPKEFMRVIDIANDNLEKKNVLMYFNDQSRQSFSKKQGWSGEIKESDIDYLMVVDANMAAYKTDAVISRQISYRADEDVNGIFSNLTINYSHGGGFDWRTTRYRTYTRVYVPEGSELIEAGGYTDGNVEVYNELGKTVFAVFLSIEPGQIGSLNFKYKLPNNNTLDAYSLYVQKQPGNKIDNLIVDLRLRNGVKSYSPTGFYVYRKGNQIRWETDFTTDRVYKINY